MWWIWFRADSITNNLLIYANNHDLFSGQPYKWLLCSQTIHILLALHKTFQTHKNICKYTNVRQQIYLEIFYFVVSTLFACCFLKWQPEKPNQREKSHGNVMEWQLYIFSSLCYDLLFRLPLFFNDVNERIFNDWRYIFACWLHTEVWYTFFTLYF